MGAGLDVVGVEANLVGGECPYWACLPTKMMVRGANALQEARRVASLAGRAEVSPSWEPVAKRIRAEATGDWDDSTATERFASRGGRLIHGRGRLTGPRTVTVGDEEIEARIGVVIATGSLPTIPPVPGLDTVAAWTNHEAIEAATLPGSIVILGGGAIGCELGQVFSRFGVRTTIVEGRDRLLAGEEPEASPVVEAALVADGVTVRTGVAARSVRRAAQATVVEFGDGSHVAAERLLVATGRHVDLSSLGVETIGLDPAARGIPVDGHLRAAEGVWAMGDVTGIAMFTHVAMYQSAIVADGILGITRPPADYRAVPRVTFTDPEVGAVGLTEEAARAEGIDVLAVTKSLGATFRGWLHATSDGVVKLVADRATGVLVGATAVGPGGGEVLGLLSLAVHARTPVSELQTMIYAFPTFHGGVGEAVGAMGRGLSTVLDPDFRGFDDLDAIVAGRDRRGRQRQI
jgi:pyruvate/2-oxoglutarate dehydrogenase complex dihydrolipoamide dehydrogenase (E3) component